MAGNRPYLVDYKNTQRMVEAASPHAAVSHVVGEDIKVTPATGADVLQWARSGKPLEKAGDKPTTETITVVGTAQQFTTADARDWLESNIVLGASADLAMTIWDSMVERDYMTADDLKELAPIVPKFVDALSWMPGNEKPLTLDAMLGLLATTSLFMGDVVKRVGDAWFIEQHNKAAMEPEAKS